MGQTASGAASRSGLLLTMIQGKIVSSESPQVSALDRGLFFGDGVYEVVQSYAGRIWGFDEHLARLDRSLREVEIENVDLEQIRSWVLEAFEAVHRTNCLIYFHVTRGCALRSHAVAEPLEPQFLLMIKPPSDNSEKVRQGTTAITYPEIRWKRCDIKSLNLLGNVLARREALKRGVDEAIFIDDGFVTEGAVSSVLAVIGGKLVTRPLGPEILPGITRQATIAIARKLGIEIEERAILQQQAYDAEELLSTGTGDEIRPVVKLDDHVIGSGGPGPVTTRLINFFVDYTRSGASLGELLDSH